MISHMISQAWYHIIAYDIICDITCEISHVISHMISQPLWYHMWYHILVSSRAAAVAGRLGCSLRVFKSWMCALRQSPTSPGARLVTMPDRHHPAPSLLRDEPGTTVAILEVEQSACMKSQIILRIGARNFRVPHWQARLGGRKQFHHPAPARWARHHCCDSWSGTVRLHEITNHSANWCSQFPSTSLAG